MAVFDKVFAVVVGAEGGFGADPRDPGNWTGGRCGLGQCRGTKYGISAASYPGLDIAGLTEDAARSIYRRDFWAVIRGDDLPPPLGLLVFDAAVNNGPGQAARWLQAALGVDVDGEIGPRTVAAAGRASLTDLLAEFQATRLLFMTGLPTWRTFGRGWARRLCRVPLEISSMGVA